MHDTGLTEQAQARGAQHVVDGLGGRTGQLPDALALPRIELAAIGGAEAGRQLQPGTAPRSGNHRNVDVGRVDRDRHVRPVAQLTGQGNPGDRLDAVEADAVQANVFREGRRIARPLDTTGEGTGHGGVPGVNGEVRQPRVIVDVVDRRFRIVERRDHLAQGEAELAVVGRRFVAPGRGEQTSGLHLLIGLHLAQVQRPATRLDHITAGEEGAATVEYAGAPVVLVETFEVGGVGQAEAEGDHLHRQLAFLDLHAGTVERRDVQRVDHVDAVLDQQRFAPGQHLVTDLYVQRMFGHLEVFPDVGIEHLEALEF
ncbi:hypothetical protein D3C73_762340 [compost metagenome]